MSRRGGRSGEPTSEILSREIEGTRAALGDTVEALAHKADVKGRSREKVEEGKERLGQLQETTKAGARSAAEQARERPAPIGGVVVALLGLLGLRRLLRRRRKDRKERRRKR